MPLIDQATLTVGAGNYYTNVVGSELPADLLNPEVGGWSNVGHTSLEDILSISSEGGEATVLGTLQNRTLRTKYSARTETLAFTLQQFDANGLRLFYGANAPTLANGMIGVPNNPVPTEAAFLAVFVDGENVFAFWAPKAEIYRADDMSLADTESLAGLPLGVKPLQLGANAYTYAVTPLGIVATGATAGIPGTFTPAGAYAPVNLAAMTGVTASPTTAWTTGQYVTLSDGTKAHWDSDSWESGPA
ncbi:hypothetical protein [Kribbella sindirgiensis]|uniref:Phage tail protein n=1 Tax=Kribbella sindirgiensis TaxID=1124744 RepID=A0A4R0I392_9ACTN|nr:hypothetical protein [Kribbella sindirgiensis]TCC19961.1 hypothetical protein E0H50_37690 [Kribbella sindirgiensis]